MTSYEHHLALAQERHDAGVCERCGWREADETRHGRLCGPCALDEWSEFFDEEDDLP